MSGATFRRAGHPGETPTAPDEYVVEGIIRSGRVGGMLRASDGRELHVTFANGEPTIPLLAPTSSS